MGEITQHIWGAVPGEDTEVVGVPTLLQTLEIGNVFL